MMRFCARLCLRRGLLSLIILLLASWIALASGPGISHLSAENQFRLNPDDAKITAAFGEALIKDNLLPDALVYLQKARSLGHISPSLNAVLAWSAKGRWQFERIKLGPGGRPAPSPDGRLVAYYQNNGLWIYQMSDGARTRLSPLIQGRNFLRWDPHGARIATVTSRELQIIDVPSGEQQFVELGSIPLARSLVWSDDGRYLAFVQTEGLSVWVYDCAAKSLRLLCRGAETAAFSRGTRALVIDRLGELSEITMDDEAETPLRRLDARIQIWSAGGRWGIGCRSLGGETDWIVGNDPIFTDGIKIRTIMSFPHCRTHALALSANGTMSAFTTGVGLPRDFFSVLWTVSSDSKTWSPVDHGQIDLSPWAISADGILLAYTKFENEEIVYLARSKK